MANLIIGHTTETTARIWIRGNRKERQCNIILEPGHNPKQSVRCEKDRDYTGVVDFTRLEPGTEYTVTATFSPESSVVRGRFSTTPGVPGSGVAAGFSFVLSSCNLSVVSINNFLAFLVATVGTSVAQTSLEAQPDRWNAPRFIWVRRLWRFALKQALHGLAVLVGATTGIKQPGPPYLRSPFLKLAAIFDAWILDVEPNRDAHFAVGDAVFTSNAKGLIAARFVPDSPRDTPGKTAHRSHDIEPKEKPEPTRLVVLQLEGAFTEGSLYKGEESDNPRKLLGTIKEVQRAKPWYERPSFFIHAGDQIYYDFPKGSQPPEAAKYRLAYREAWFDDEPNRYLLAHWPQYMTLDDHEIADQFALDFKPPGDAFASTYLDEAGIAYREYVAALVPALSTGPGATGWRQILHASSRGRRSSVRHRAASGLASGPTV